MNWRRSCLVYCNCQPSSWCLYPHTTSRSLQCICFLVLPMLHNRLLPVSLRKCFELVTELHDSHTQVGKLCSHNYDISDIVTTICNERAGLLTVYRHINPMLSSLYIISNSTWYVIAHFWANLSILWSSTTT